MNDTPSPEPRLTTDLLGEPWVARRLEVTESPAAPGADHAVLVHQRGAVPAGHGPRHRRAVLYLHGRNDYFFQTWLAEAFLDAGYEFYAMELRACGRAGAGHPSPHDVRDLRVHHEEIAACLDIIRLEHGHEQVVLNAHSTGGLSALIWAKDHPGTVDAITLNSPWLDLNSSALMRSYGSAYVDLVSRIAPDRVIEDPEEAKAMRAAVAAQQVGVRGHAHGGGLVASSPAGTDPGPVGLDLYARSLHERWGGPWSWDLALKPSPAFPVCAAFLAGIRRLQREVHHGLGLEVPVLVCCSTRSCSHAATAEEARHADVVLSVRQIVSRSAHLGTDVTVVQIPDGVHDLALSLPPACQEYLAVLTGWLDARLG
ncbi:MAG: alpha/beta hydrolase [Actinomyces sp.]|uniref:alpha/beta hydrolase n=1 Tax=Actinomyces sp. TaxID=29317 RepID=UPI0026DCC822|nr:alpha/beta hydrolase [Actinomyces sp.]MDO4243614.1 alpha/beta hydrolase [Actinomyces sp.]